MSPSRSERYLPIAEHGIIGDLRSAALVGTDGTVDWFCPGRFDAPSVFASLLDADREIALRRAEAVQRAVSAAAVTANLSRIDLRVDAFGEAMPIACDDSEWGRQANRRVEVWVR